MNVQRNRGTINLIIQDFNNFLENKSHDGVPKTYVIILIKSK